jgi:DNA-3-methyladenine glycosylase
LGRTFFARPALVVARDLLGCVLVVDRPVGRVGVRLTEVEAYDGEADPGSHAFRGPTPRNAVMYGPAGHLYVYFTYGMHWCANVVCGPEGVAAAVLLRGGEIVEGLDLARSRRPSAKSDRDLARGPARLASALGIGADDYGADLCAPASGPDRPLQWVTRDRRAAGDAVRTGPRVGISGAGGDSAAYPWRFWLADEPTVSAYRQGKVRVRRPQ